MVDVVYSLEDTLAALLSRDGLVTVALEMHDGTERTISGSYNDVGCQLSEMDKDRLLPNVKAVRVRHDPRIPDDMLRPSQVAETE